MNNLKFALRQLLKSPGFTSVAVLTLALCIGANLTIFAVVDAVLLQPLPFPAADRLITIFHSYPKAGVERGGASLTRYYERRGQIPALSHISALRYGSAIVGEPGVSGRREVLQVTPEFFTTLGVHLVKGRAFTEEEMTPQTDAVAIVSERYSRQHLNAGQDVLGRLIRVDGRQKTIVGVLPSDFKFLSSEADVFLPLSSDLEERGVLRRHNSGTEVIARLAPQATLAEARAQIEAHHKAHAAEFPWAKDLEAAGYHETVTPLHADHVKSSRRTLLVLQSSALCLLILGGVNVVNLLLIRASSRTKELAIRQSLGAGRWHVARQAFVETGLLAFVGGLAGLITAAAGIRALAVFGTDQIPLGARVAFDERLAVAALLLVVALGVVFALPIAWFNLRGHILNSLQSESRSGTASRSVQRLRNGFIVAQIVLAFVLLVGAGLLGISLQRAMTVSPGFRADHVLTGRIVLPEQTYPNDLARLGWLERLLERLRPQPGISAAGATTALPVHGREGDVSRNAMTVPGHVPEPGRSPILHYRHGVSGEYFAVMGIPLIEGRFLENSDSRSDGRVCVVDEDLARHYWSHRSAVGQRLFEGPPHERDETEAFTVVGVVGSVRQTELTDPNTDGAVYFPYRYNADSGVFVVLRTDLKPESLARVLQSTVRTLDPELPVDDIRSMEERITDTLGIRRSPALLIGLFASVALLLAAIGTYGVLSYAVGQRRREIGVRMALGALPRQMLAYFLAYGARLLAVGVILGVICSWGVGRAIQGMLFGVGAIHVGVLAATAGLLMLTVLVAILVPSLRASRVNPMEALRTE